MGSTLEIVEIRSAEELTWVIGYAVLDLQTKQFESVHILSWTEATTMLKRQQEAALIRENWPEPDDPEVIALLNDQSFVPPGDFNLDVLDSPVYRLHMAAEAIARKRAGLETTSDSLGTI